MRFSADCEPEATTVRASRFDLRLLERRLKQGLSALVLAVVAAGLTGKLLIGLQLAGRPGGSAIRVSSRSWAWRTVEDRTGSALPSINARYRVVTTPIRVQCRLRKAASVLSVIALAGYGFIR
jgi:hypothetical protein